MANLRHDAREAVARAREELAGGDEWRLRYAALELRFAMEALTYDRANAYKDEIPPAEYGTWQPRKVLELLLEIDPRADEGSSLSFGKEEEYGKPAKTMVSLGSETVLNLQTLKAHYDALGSFLHMPTWKQWSEGPGPDLAKLRARCDEIAALLDGVLASTVFNVTLGSFAEMACRRCTNPVRKRIPPGADQLEARCFGCGATYLVKDEAEGQVLWKADGEEVPCPSPGCDEQFWLWRDKIQVGTWWTCKGCGQRYEIGLCFSKSAGDPG